MADIQYDSLFNRILDITAVIHMPIKLFAMYVVIKYTPNSHRYHSYFILNIMFWNFISNLVFAFMHPNPLFPAECFRLDGLSRFVQTSESIGHSMFIAEYCGLSNCGLAIILSFLYRYIDFAYPQFSPKTVWVLILCGGAHLFSTALFVPLGVQWMISYDDYPEKAELPDGTSAFCFYPHGYHKSVTLVTYMSVVIVGLIAVCVFSVLFLSGIRGDKQACHSQTIALQKKLFNSLVIITVIALLFMAIPLLIAVFAAYFPHLPYARYTSMVCLVVLSNHGTINSVTYLILFKAYRSAVKRMVSRLFGKKGRWRVTINYVHQNLSP